MKLFSETFQIVFYGCFAVMLFHLIAPKDLHWLTAWQMWSLTANTVVMLAIAQIMPDFMRFVDERKKQQDDR